MVETTSDHTHLDCAEPSIGPDTVSRSVLHNMVVARISVIFPRFRSQEDIHVDPHAFLLLPRRATHNGFTITSNTSNQHGVSSLDADETSLSKTPLYLIFSRRDYSPNA
jgi:hypothetical protein